MDNSFTGILSAGLDYGSARLSALSNNLSNVSTPGYQRQDVSFGDLLQSALSPDNSLSMETSSPLDLSLPAGELPTPTVQTMGGGAQSRNGNNVDVDVENSRLAAAQIQYSGVAQLLAGHFSQLKYVISGG